MYLRHQDRLALACLGLVVLIALGAAVSYVASRHAAWAERIDGIEPRYARLLGLEAAQPRLEAAEAAARATMSKYMYAPEQDATQAGNDAQQKIRAIFTQAKLDISSSQVLAPKTEGDIERIPLSVRADGDLPALQAALAGIAAQAPAILIDRVTIQGSSFARSDVVRLGAQFSFSVLRARP